MQFSPPAPQPSDSGLFISFEGGDGAGKSTQADLLARRLGVADQTGAVLRTREPGGTPVGLQIRQVLLHGDDVSDRAEALLYAADRAHHVATVVRPALARGEIVITDRYMDSSMAYQSAARGLERDDIRGLSLWAVQGLVPDLTVLLDVPVSAGRGRLGGTYDRLEREGEVFHERVRTAFLDLARESPERYLVLDGTQPPEQIAERVFAEVSARLGAIMGEREVAP